MRVDGQLLFLPPSLSQELCRRIHQWRPSPASSNPNPPPPLTDYPKASRNFQWEFLGCPGIETEQYASRVPIILGVPHIATGDLVLEELSSSGRLFHQSPSATTIFIFLQSASQNIGSSFIAPPGR
ncbi:hypothetical protein L1887_38573 [Cichorium endivia]|nr:hypothetical protein L1887_38573 [Cichorium endivia]